MEVSGSEAAADIDTITIQNELKFRVESLTLFGIPDHHEVSSSSSSAKENIQHPETEQFLILSDQANTQLNNMTMLLFIQSSLLV